MPIMVHYPVNTVKRINEFSWTMVELKILIDRSVHESCKRLNQFYKIAKRNNFDITLTDNVVYKYQDVTLQNYEASLNVLSNNYKKFISK